VFPRLPRPTSIVLAERPTSQQEQQRKRQKARPQFSNC
jgi:hypothetical protein